MSKITYEDEMILSEPVTVIGYSDDSVIVLDEQCNIYHFYLSPGEPLYMFEIGTHLNAAGLSLLPGGGIDYAKCNGRI